MSWIRVATWLLLCGAQGANAAEVCPADAKQPLRYVDVFDGAPEELATLVPDVAKKTNGYWQLGYIYTAGRYVTVRCKYADGHAVDVKLNKSVKQCRYQLNSKKILKLRCQ